MYKMDKRPIVVIAVAVALLILGLLARLPIGLNTAFASPTHLPTFTPVPAPEGQTPHESTTIPPTSAPAGPRLPAGATVYYVDGRSGLDTNPGTPDAPWKTVQHAMETIKSGDAVLFAAGIYRLSKPLTFAPAGLGPDSPTVFAAAPGARVIFTGSNGEAPDIYLGGDYIRLDGLWFGGKFNATVSHIVAPGGNPVGLGKEIVNCTFFGYNGGIVIGSSERLLIQNNRFVNDGYGRYAHTLYLTGGPQPGQYSQHVIVDHNILIGRQGGYGMVIFNSAPGAPHNFILTRNFITRQWWGSAAYGSDHLIANNFYWKESGRPGIKDTVWGPQANDTHSMYLNNVMEAGGWMTAGFGFPPSLSWTLNTYDHNAHQLTGKPPAAMYAITGTNQITLTRGTELAEYGVTAVQIDSAIAALRRSFTRPMAYILADQTIERNFAALTIKVPSTSPLYQTGNPWFGQPINVGPDAGAPATADEFWAAFRALGLREYDRDGNPITP